MHCAAGLAASCAPVFVTAGRGAPDGPAARRPRQRSSRGRARRRAAAAHWMHGVLLGLLAAARAARSAPSAGPRSAGPGAAGMAGDLMGVNDVRVARVERRWRLLPAGRSGAAPRRYGFASSAVSFPVGTAGALVMSQAGITGAGLLEAPVPVLPWPGLRTAIPSLLSVSVSVLHVTKRPGPGRHPKVPCGGGIFGGGIGHESAALAGAGTGSAASPWARAGLLAQSGACTSMSAARNALLHGRVRLHEECPGECRGATGGV